MIRRSNGAVRRWPSSVRAHPRPPTSSSIRSSAIIWCCNEQRPFPSGARLIRVKRCPFASIAGLPSDRIERSAKPSQIRMATWKTTLPLPLSYGPYTMTVEGKNKLTLNDVLVGEVWICSGPIEHGMACPREFSAPSGD